MAFPNQKFSMLPFGDRNYFEIDSIFSKTDNKKLAWVWNKQIIILNSCNMFGVWTFINLWPDIA